MSVILFFTVGGIGTILGALFFTFMLRPKIGRVKTCLILFLIIMIPGIIFTSLPQYTMLKAPIMLAMIIAAIILLFENAFWQKMLCLCIYMFIGISCEMLSAGVLKILYNEPFILKTSPVQLWITYGILSFGSISILYGLAIFLKGRINFRSIAEFPKQGSVNIALFLGTEIVMVIIMLYIVYKNQIFSPFLISAWVVFMFLSILTAIWIIHINTIRARNEAELEFTSKQLDIQLKHDEQLREQYDNMRKIRHDYHSHLKTLSVMKNSGNFTELGKYIDSLTEEIDFSERVTFCNRSAVDAVLFYANRRAKQADINIEFQVYEAEKAPASDVKICAILSNLLNNALEECERLDGDRQILLKTGIKSGSYIILLTNTSEEPNLDFKTKKAVKENHGLGLRIVKTLVQELGGKSSFSCKDEIFCSMISLPLPESKK